MNREQRWLEELLADKGYKFLYSDGDDAYWQFDGLTELHTVCVTKDGTVKTSAFARKSR